MYTSSERLSTSVGEFSRNINSFVLTFKDPDLEKLYRERRVDPLSINMPFKVVLIVLLLLIAVRRVELVIFSFYSVETTILDDVSWQMEIGLLVATCFAEAIAYWVKVLRSAKGFIAMVYIFFLVTYASFESEGERLWKVPLQALLLIQINNLEECQLTWELLCLGRYGPIHGLYPVRPASQAMSLPLYSAMQRTFSFVLFMVLYFKIDELAFFDATYFFAYALLVTFFYTLEYKVRYDFFLNHTHAELQKSYRKLLEKLPNSVIVFDQENNPLFYNQLVAKMVDNKYPRPNDSQPIKQPIPKEEFLPVLADVVQQINESITLKDVVENWTSGVLNDDNKYIYKNEQNEFTYTIQGIETLFQATPCKALIMQDQSAFEKLTKLDEKYQKLYVASIVHDIRTPLNGIIGMLEMIDSSTKSPEKKTFISVAKKTCKLLLFLTYDITDYSQLEAGKFKANNSMTNIKDILEEVSQLLSFSFERKGLGSCFEVTEGVPAYVFIDKNRYMQILLNLVGNALKFTFKGEIRVWVEYDQPNDILVTVVKDSGVGIKPEELPKLFQFFGKLDSTSGMNPQGVGFGLAICKRLAESLGGFINAASTYGDGSTFTFGIKANIAGSTHSKHDSGVMDTSSRIVPGEIDKKVQGYEFTKEELKMEPHNRLLTIERNEESEQNGKYAYPQSPRRLAEIEESKECECRKILIVDDGEYNLFVLQNYLKSIKVAADEVHFVLSN
eukprot:TRINITY_DN71772_c1_g1_i1.p1 TRINITY_DN71772_c1_g1~~TRINITY_DN71772_c1_g1_i1.p1  ORF type:complete len:729 (-),score=75.62 TRINITY_DN71772_c1_g1_i1:423-2609(-)